ncbi:MAG: periplasmic heavy metal sensor [Lacunisphaera sp.]
MKTVLGFFLAVIAVAALSAFCTLRWSAAHLPVVSDPHQWLHEQLQLTPEQHAALGPIETQYAEKHRRLTAQLQGANRELARAIGEGKTYSPAVSAAVEKIHQYMGEMQKLSIEHLFKMREVLTPEQGEKLIHLAQQALESSP